MIKCKEKLKQLGVIGALALTCAFTTPIQAMAGNPVVYDEAELLTDEEFTEVANEAGALEDKTGWEVMVLTVQDAGGYTTQEYSEEFLNENLIGDDGVVYTIDMDNREVYIATTGNSIYYLTDDRIQDVIDAGYDEVKNEAYADAFTGMIRATADWYEEGIPADQYTYDTDTGEIVPYQKPMGLDWFEVLIAIVIAAVAFGIVFASVAGKYRLKWGTYKYDFRKNSDVRLKNEEDRLVNQFVTHRHIPKETSSGSSSSGQSSIHTGSGGRSYGGGGRKF